MINIESPKEMLNFLVQLNDGFYEYWNKNHNYNTTEDGVITYAGICNDYAHYLIDSLENMSIKKIECEVKKTLIELEYIIIHENYDAEIKNAIKTCFLEDIAQTKSGEAIKMYMGAATKEYFNKWHATGNATATKINNFNQLKKSAILLEKIFIESRSPIAKEFLFGNLGKLLKKIISSESFELLTDVPAFDLMTRGVLPEAEEAYLNFYSLVCFDKPAKKH